MELLKFECAHCDKTIVSIYEKQFKYNVEQHEKKHAREQARKNKV